MTTLTRVETIGNSCRTTTATASIGAVLSDKFDDLVYRFTSILTYRHGVPG
jgi:hypothetical protein